MNTAFESLLGYDAVSVSKHLQTFRRIRVPSPSRSSGPKKALSPLKHWELLTQQHSIISQKNELSAIVQCGTQISNRDLNFKATQGQQKWVQTQEKNVFRPTSKGGPAANFYTKSLG
jgi:hypothetical protein